MQKRVKIRGFSFQIRLLAAVLLGFTLAGCQPSAQFTLVDGQQIRLSQHQGEWVLVNFWAEWCRPCIEEVPELNEIHRQRKSLGAVLYAFSYDKVSNDTLAAAQSKFAMEYPLVATDPMPLVPFERPAQLPAMIFIDPEGKVHGPLYGKQDMTSVANALEELSRLTN